MAQRERLQNIKMQVLKSGCLESAQHIKFQLIRLFYLCIWWCETTEGFIDSHFDIKVSNIFSVAMGLIILHSLDVGSNCKTQISMNNIVSLASAHFCSRDCMRRFDCMAE